MGKKGYVYILKNGSIPGLVKIGSTKKDPHVRAKELSSTGVPSPYIVHASFEIEGNYSKAEKAVHEHLEKFRLSSNREFFKIIPEQAKEILSEFLNKKTTDEEHFENWKSKKEKELQCAMESIDNIFNQISEFRILIAEKIDTINKKAEALNLIRPSFLVQLSSLFKKDKNASEWCDFYRVWIRSKSQLESEIKDKCKGWRYELEKVDNKFNHGWRRSSYMNKNIRIFEQHINTKYAKDKIKEIESLKIIDVNPPGLMNY